MKSPSKKPAKPFMGVGGVYKRRDGFVDEILDHEGTEAYPWRGKSGDRYQENGKGYTRYGEQSAFDLIARVSIRVIRRNPNLKGTK